MPLFKLATKAKDLSYSPYSRYRVGCALKTEKNIYLGANVENASFAAGICAERSAVINARMSGDTSKIVELAVTTDGDEVITPCGICRQFLREFGLDMNIHMYNAYGKHEVRTLEELLPLSFGPNSMN